MSALPRRALSSSTLEVAQSLLGVELVTAIDGEMTVGRIVEVEAYHGKSDQACHCYHRRTPRNEVMFWEAGFCYVYLIYGMHHCVNVVTEPEEVGAAVLIRAVEPVVGIEIMRRRRGVTRDQELTNGPGKLCQAFGITKELSGEHFLRSSYISLRKGSKIERSRIETSTRIGISKSKELPWRFFVADSPFVSKK